VHMHVRVYVYALVYVCMCRNELGVWRCRLLPRYISESQAVGGTYPNWTLPANMQLFSGC